MFNKYNQQLSQEEYIYFFFISYNQTTFAINYLYLSIASIIFIRIRFTVTAFRNN